MHKLETTLAAPVAQAIFTVQSESEAPTIILTTSDSWKPSEDDWLKDDTKRKQVISFISDEGRTVELAGAVSEPNAVECPAAHKVVALVTLRLDRKSGQMRLAVARIVEVWASGTKKLWAAPDWQQKPGSTLASDGKITKAA